MTFKANAVTHNGKGGNLFHLLCVYSMITYVVSRNILKCSNKRAKLVVKLVSKSRYSVSKAVKFLLN